MKNIGTVIIIGLLVWWLSQRKIAQAAEEPLMRLFPHPVVPSEYELLHRVMPIIKFVEKEIPVFTSIDEWREATYE